MTQFKLYKDGKEAGTIDVTDDGVSIISEEYLCRVLDEEGIDFICVGFDKAEGATSYFFKARMPSRSMVHVLVKLKPLLENAGYEVLC